MPSEELNKPQSIWPTGREVALLRAIYHSGEQNADALSEWPIDELERDCQRLLPLLYKVFKNKPITTEAAVSQLMKQGYLQAWGTNKILFYHLQEVLRLLHEAEVPTLLVKGSALTPLYYGNDYGLRPMNDIDVLVPVGQIEQAMGILGQNGWLPQDRGLERFTDAYISIAHSHPFRKTGSYECDLHWHLLPECCRTDDDEDFWRDSIPVEVAGVSTRVLNPADQLLHLCAHGARWNHNRSIHWLVDVMMVLKHESIDWDRFMHQVNKRRLFMPVRETLVFLSGQFDVPVPQDIIGRLASSKISKIELREYEYQLLDHDRKALGYMPIIWFRYKRWAGNINALRLVIGFPSYLLSYWGAENVREFLGFLLTMTKRKLQ